MRNECWWPQRLHHKVGALQSAMSAQITCTQSSLWSGWDNRGKFSTLQIPQTCFPYLSTYLVWERDTPCPGECMCYMKNEVSLFLLGTSKWTWLLQQSSGKVLQGVACRVVRPWRMYHRFARDSRDTFTCIYLLMARESQNSTLHEPEISRLWVKPQEDSWIAKKVCVQIFTSIASPCPERARERERSSDKPVQREKNLLFPLRMRVFWPQASSSKKALSLTKSMGKTLYSSNYYSFRHEYVGAAAMSRQCPHIAGMKWCVFTAYADNVRFLGCSFDSFLARPMKEVEENKQK